MAANVGKSPRMEENFSRDEKQEKDLRSLSAAIMAATERAELVAHETDRWLSGHQEFDTLDVVHSLVSEAEGRLVQIRQMTVIQELDKFMDEITVNAPIEQAKQLNALMSTTKETFSGAIDSLERFVQRSENIDKAYNKYKESEHTLGQVLNDTSNTLQQISHHSDLADVTDQVEAVKSSRGMLSRMKTCLRNMKDAMAGIESLTLTVCDLGMEHYMKQYKQRRAELSDALARLESVQSELERFVALHSKCESCIAELNGALREPVTDSKEMEHLRSEAEQVQLYILDMERLVESLENQNIRGGQRNQLSIIQESYAKLVSTLSAAYSTSYKSSLSASPRGKSPQRSPRHRHSSDSSTPRQSLRQWLRSKTDELQELMTQPFPFEDKRIQTFWHSIQKYQGDLVVKGEEFSLYAIEGEGDQPAMDQITPLIDTCADLSYKLDVHARLCVQYAADQNGLLSELRSLEEAKGSLQHADIPLREQHRRCADLLDQVTSLKRRVHDQLTNKLPAITVNLAKKEGGAIHTDTSELDASVSKLKLELKAFFQSLEASISNLNLLTKQLTDLHQASSQLDQSPDNFTFNESISRENVVDALGSCKRQLSALSERQQYIDKLLSEKGTAIGQLPIPDDEQLSQTLAESKSTADRARRKLEQHHSNLTTLQETVERFDTRCDEAKDSLRSAESLLNQASGPSKQNDVLKETIETVTTECKTRLHECVTYIEQAEIAVTEMEQNNDGSGKMDPHKDTIKEIQAKHKALSARLREVEKKVAMVADNQRTLDSLSHKFDEWLKSAQGTIGDNVSLDSDGLNDMRDHIIRLHELEKSVDATGGWLMEMKKLCRSLNQSVTPEGQEENSQLVNIREQQFEQLKGTLSDRIDGLSREMEVVVAWIQKSSDLIGKLNHIRYQLTELSNKETDSQSMHLKLDTLKNYLDGSEALLAEFTALLDAIPQAVTDRQRSSCANGKESCEELLGDLTSMYNNLSQVEKVWTEFDDLAAEVKDHHRHCESQLNTVSLPGVSLDARQQRYQEIVEALEEYPEGTSPAYLQELLSTCPIASPGLYTESIALMDEHEKLLSIAKKGTAEFTQQLQARSELESRLKSVTGQLKEMSEELENSVQLDNWSSHSCDSALRMIKTQETELKTLSERINPMISAQKEQHASSEETMTLDLKDSIDEYTDIERELTAQLVQEKEVVVLAREFCQYLTESITTVEDWLSRSTQLSDDIASGRASADTIEHRLQLCLGEVPEVREHLGKISGYSEQVSSSLTQSAAGRLAELVNDLTSNTNQSESGLKELIDHHGQLGKTKVQHSDQLQRVEEVIKSVSNQLNAVNSSKARSLEDCEEKLLQIQALEVKQPEVDSGVQTLYETTSLLTSLLQLPEHQPNEYEQGVKQLCVDKWSTVKAKLLQAKKEVTASLGQFEELDSQYQAIEEGACSRLEADIKELEAIDLHSLPVEELNILATKAGQCSANVSDLWQKSLSAQQLESSLLSKMAADAKKSTRSTELSGQLTRLAARCQAIEGDIEQTCTESQQTCASLQQCLEEMSDVQQLINQTDEISDVHRQQEQLQQAKNEVSKLYQVSNEVMSSLPSHPPPDVSCIMNSIQNLNESLLDDVQVKLGQAERVMDQWNVVHVMQQELESWMNNARQTMSAEIVDSQVALDQQKEMEDHVVKCKDKLDEFTLKSHDLERSVGSLESQRLLETASHFQNNLGSIKQGLDKRRQQVSELVKEEENFQNDLQEVAAIISDMNSLTRQEVTDVTPEKCEQLANQYQEEVKKMPAVEKKLNDLIALSIRLGDSSHHTDSTTKVLDLKKEWSGTKEQLSQQANTLKEATRMLLSAPRTPAAVSHDDWVSSQDKIKSHAEDSLRDLHLKVDGTELMQAEQVMSQLRLYESEGSKLNGLSGKIQELVTRKEQLQEASLDPLMLKDWAGQMMKIDSELKQLYMKSEETVKRQANVIEKAHKLAEEGMKREQVMEELIVPQPSNALDLSIDSEVYIDEAPKTAVTPHQLSQDEHAAKLFTVERNPETVQAEKKMHKMISEQESLQTTLSDVNRSINQWQWTLEQDYHTTGELNDTLGAIQQAKVQLDTLCKSERAAQEPSLSVLSMSLETLELRCLSEIQRAEANDNLSQDHKETLESIEEEVVACQKYLDDLSTMPGGAEEKLPGVEHRVSKLQRMYQTLKLINPRLCEGSLVSEYLGQLMNDLQVLQGRLEVIPEEDDFHTHGKELHSWQEHMAEHVSQHEANSDRDFVDRVVRDLNTSLGTLANRPYRDAYSKYIGDSLNTYRELLSAAKQGLKSGRLVDSEHAAGRKENLQGLFTLFESYRLHMGSLSLTPDGEELKTTLSDLSKATQEVQRDLWCEGETCGRLKDKTVSLCYHCDTLSQSLSHLQSDFLSNQINVGRLERSLTQTEPEFQGLTSAVNAHLTSNVHCTELKDKVHSLQQLWDSLQEHIENLNTTETDGVIQLSAELIALQQNSQRKLDLSAPLNICLNQALDMLVNLDTYNWLYKDLYSEKTDIDLEIKSSILSIKPRMNAIRADLKAKLRECFNSPSEEICKVYTWLGEVKPFSQQLSVVSAIDDYLQSLLAYQCGLGQRSYITGLMMSLVTSCDHDVIVTSQHTVKVLHEAKMAGSKQLASAHSLRNSYKAYESSRRHIEDWIADVQLLSKDCPIGCSQAVSWLLHRTRGLHDVGSKMCSEKEELAKKTEILSSEVLCSQMALREMSKQVKDLLNKQETSMRQLSTLIKKLEEAEIDWRQYNKVYTESCSLLDSKEYLLETVPSLAPTETLQTYQTHLSSLRSLLADSVRQTDKIQPIAHKLRLSLTVPSTLQELDTEVKGVKNREYKMYSQRIPLMVERWLKAQNNMSKYEHCVNNITGTIQEIESILVVNCKENAGMSEKEMECCVREYEKMSHRLHSVDWNEIERHSTGVAQLTGITLHQVHLRRRVEELQTILVGLLTEASESCAELSHSSQSMHSLETKLNKMERDPLITNSQISLSYKALLERRSKTEQLLYALLSERQTLDTVQSHVSCSTTQQLKQLAEISSVLESRYKHVLELITSKLLRLQEEIIEHADINELQSAYQDWKNQVIRLTSVQFIGDVKDLEEQRLKCLLHINLSPSEKLSLTAISKATFSLSDHEQLLDSLHARESHLISLLLKHRLFNRLKGAVTHSLNQLDSHLHLPDHSYESHATLTGKVPILKAIFEQHQRSSLVMRQICQELLPHCNSELRSCLLTSVQTSSTRWQSVLSRFITQSDESMTVISNTKRFNHSLYSLVKELGGVRHGCCGSLPEHHDHLQERQSYADVYQWRLEKLSSKSSVLKFDISTLESQADHFTDMEICFNLTQTLMTDSESMLRDLKQELGDRLSVWSMYVSEVNALLQQLQQLEKLYMNEKRLTIEELLEEITTKYSLQLNKLQKKSEAMITHGTSLLSTTGDLYGSAIQHGVVSLENSIKHLHRLSTTRTSKLRDTMSAILEFEHGMKSLNQWFKSTESSLTFAPPDWQDSTLLYSNQYLLQLEKDISHHSRTVTAVINLCSLLQYDRDAGYDQVVKRELAAVKERLSSRWKKLCEKIIMRKEHLYELGQAWSQMKVQTDSIIADLLRYKEKCEDYSSRSKVIRPQTHQLSEFSGMLRDCENRHEDMRLLNNRHRYLIRQNMLDTSECIRKAVGRCTELWDSVYQTLSSLVKEMKSSYEVWTDFVKERDSLLAKVSNLSLILKTKPASRADVERKLIKYQSEVEALFAQPLIQLRPLCSTEQNCKLDNMIRELTVNIDTLKSELRPLDDLHVVEQALDLFVQQTEDIEHDLESLNSLDVQTTNRSSVDLLSNIHTAAASGKVADIERRVDEIAQKASLRRKITPSITARGSSESLDTLTDQSAMSAQHQPRLLSPSSDRSISGERNDRLALIGSQRPSRIVIGSPLRSSSASCSALNKSPVCGLPSAFRCHWLKQPSTATNASCSSDSSKSFSRPSPSSSAPFQRYLSARRRSLSRDRGDLHETERSANKRTRSVSLERGSTIGERLPRGRTQSARSPASSDLFPTELRQSPTTGSTPSPLPALSIDGSCTTDYLLSASPVMSSVNSTNRKAAEEQTITEGRQLQLDVRHTMEWIDKIEVLYTSVWNTSPVQSTLTKLIQCCRQYNDLLSQYHYFKNLVTSINLLSNLKSAAVKERERMNKRWQQGAKYLPSRQLQLESAVISSQELSKEVDKFCDSVTHSELKILSGTHNKQNMAGEVRQTLVCIRSYITLLTSLLCESEGTGKYLLDMLRAGEVKCQNILS